MGSIRRKAHRLPRTHMAMVSIPVGQWRKYLGKGRRRAHIAPSFIVMDIATCKVSHYDGAPEADATALPQLREQGQSPMG